MPAGAKKKVTLSGYMRDGSSGEALIAATVYVKELGGWYANQQLWFLLYIHAGRQLYSYILLCWFHYPYRNDGYDIQQSIYSRNE